MNPEFWSGKRVFITGHTGFKGGWLSLWLQQLGAKLTGFALEPPTHPSLFVVARVAEGMNSIIGDIRDVHSLNKAIHDAKPEIVIHMAAQPLVRRSYSNPVETYTTNVMGTVHVLEAVRQTPSVRAVLNVTTDKCYDNKEWVWGYRENEPLGGYDPYSSSKACSELVTLAYRNSFFNVEHHGNHSISLASARAGNVIGGGDWAEDRLIPDIMRALSKNESVFIRNPHATRPWQHVLEPLSGYLLLAERLYQHGQRDAEAWNFGPHDEDARPVYWIVEYLCGLWGSDASWSSQTGDHPHEASYLKLDISKARQRLGWEPRWSLEKALKYVVDWHQAWLKGEDIRSMCLNQINKYHTEV